MYSSTHSLTSALDGGEWSASRPGRFAPQGKSPWYPLDRRLGGPQSRAGRGGEEKNSRSPPRIEPKNPDSPARSPALCRLSYHGCSWRCCTQLKRKQRDNFTLPYEFSESNVSSHLLSVQAKHVYHFNCLNYAPTLKTFYQSKTSGCPYVITVSSKLMGNGDKTPRVLLTSSLDGGEC
jgi:hypothetical protein